MPLHLIDLPECIFLLLQTYLSHEEYRNLFNSSKNEYLQELKRSTCCYYLHYWNSWKYSRDKTFRKRVLSLMIDPTKQLGLNGETYSGKYIAFKVFSNVCSVRLNANDDNCEELKKLTNFSQFACVKYLRISDLPQIQNCNGFQSLIHLKLSSCDNLMDVSALANCHSLMKIEIGSCPSLTDVNCLTHIMDMKLSNCPISNQGIAGLGTSLKSLQLYDMKEITNVDHIHSLERLLVQSCENFMSISGHQQLKTFSARWCHSFQSYSDLPSLNRLEVMVCPKFEFNFTNTLQMKSLLLALDCFPENTMNLFWSFDKLEVLMLSLDYKQNIDVNPIASLPHLKRLELSRIIHKDFNIHLFQQVTWLSVSRAVHCYGITQPMPNLRVLQLTLCRELTTISGLKMNRNMKLLIMCCNELLPDMNLYQIILEVADYLIMDMYKTEIEKAAPLLPIHRTPKRKPAIVRDKYVEFQGYIPYRGKLLEHLLENVRYLKLHGMCEDYTDLSSLSDVGIHKVPILYLTQFHELTKLYPMDVKPEHQRLLLESCYEFTNLKSISCVPRVSICSYNQLMDLNDLRKCKRIDYSFSYDEDINDRKFSAIKDRLYRWKVPQEEVDLHRVFHIENQYKTSSHFASSLLSV